ncbi:MAG: hypothetical protein Q4B59_00695 [Lachnospiraceae bacterium]|nr:hypothetical protein [Lachnospiraceae bacterium]
MNVKSLKKQLMAAIAMVCVAALALGSSTFAWFVSNNSVEATTATISAQSNAPFLKIDKTAITADSETSISFVASPAVDTKLYPAQVVKAAGTETYKNGTSTATMAQNKPLFQSAYASAATATTMLAGSRFNVGTAEIASKADTVAGGGYALKESFKIGTSDAKAGSFADLKVASVTLTNTTSSQLTDALCVLVVCGDNWAVYKATADGTVLAEYNDKTSAVGNNTNGVLASTIAATGSVDVDVYVFYDGSATNVYTDNLANLKAIGATVAFTATPVATNGATS